MSYIYKGTNQSINKGVKYNKESRNQSLGQYFMNNENEPFSKSEREVFPQLSEPNEFSYPVQERCNILPHFLKKTVEDGPRRFGSTPYSRPPSAFIPLQERPSNTRANTYQTNLHQRTGFKIENHKFTRRDTSTIISQQQKTSEFSGAKFRHLTGSVDHIVRWHRMIKSQDLFVSYEVSGILENMITKGCKQLLFLRGESGHVLQGVFFAIDRSLPAFKIGSAVTATGRMVGGNKLHVFDAIQTTEEEQQLAKRLWFLCQRSLEALV